MPYKKKPIKKSDTELWRLIAEKILSSNYLFKHHAKSRQKTRGVSDIDVLDILENKAGRKRKRNKKKDIYTPGHLDWNYCIEGLDLNKEKIRIAISFDEKFMLVITVVRVNNPE